MDGGAVGPALAAVNADTLVYEVSDSGQMETSAVSGIGRVTASSSEAGSSQNGLRRMYRFFVLRCLERVTVNTLSRSHFKRSRGL